MPADTDQPTLAVTQSDSEFLYDLAGRLFRHATPAMGFDQCDTDRLYRMARTTHEPRPAGDLRGLLTRITVAHNRLHRSEITPQEFDEYALGLLATHSPAPMAGEPKVFLDCDGVLADFDTYAEAYFGMNPREYEKRMGSTKFWQQLEAKGDFYRNLPLMPDAMALYEGVKHLHPTILTGCPRGDWAQGQKVAWAAEHFPGVPIITCRSADKRDYAKPGDLLIDDWPQHRHRWIEMGGVFIVHHDAASSLAALWAHYPALAAHPSTQEGGK